MCKPNRRNAVACERSGMNFGALICIALHCILATNDAWGLVRRNRRGFPEHTAFERKGIFVLMFGIRAGVRK